MNSESSGISSPLEIYKESTSKKNKQDKKKLFIQFIIIFILSHTARTIIELDSPPPLIQEKRETGEGYILMELEVSSIIPDDQFKANLIHQASFQEIEHVKIIHREMNQDGLLKVKIEVPTHKSTWIINKPNNWKLIPYRKVTSNKRINYEINF